MEASQPATHFLQLDSVLHLAQSTYPQFHTSSRRVSNSLVGWCLNQSMLSALLARALACKQNQICRICINVILFWASPGLFFFIVNPEMSSLSSTLAAAAEQRVCLTPTRTLGQDEPVRHHPRSAPKQTNQIKSVSDMVSRHFQVYCIVPRFLRLRFLVALRTGSCRVILNQCIACP